MTVNAKPSARESLIHALINLLHKKTFYKISVNELCAAAQVSRSAFYSHFDDKYVAVTIEDNGNGIAPEDLKVIFDKYYSGKSLERKLGSGFGLSVCKNIIAMHGGEITVESELNKYTKFTVKLPLESKI